MQANNDAPLDIIDKSVALSEGSLDIPEAFDQFELGASFDQVVSRFGKPVSNFLSEGLVVRWRRNDGQAYLTFKDNKITERQSFGAWPEAFGGLETFEQAVKLLLITQLAPRRAGLSRRLVHRYQSSHGAQRDPVPERPLPV